MELLSRPDKSVDTFEQINKRFLSVSFRKSFLSIAKPPCPPFQRWNTLSGHHHVAKTWKREEGVEMWILEINYWRGLSHEMVFEETLRQKGENRFCCLRKFCFFTVHMSKTVDFNRFTTVHIPNLRNNRYSLFSGMWTVVSRCKAVIVARPPQRIYYEYILEDRSRKSGFYGWQLFPRTVAMSAIACVMLDLCCWVQSLGL